jgi:hypothetical protein
MQCSAPHHPLLLLQQLRLDWKGVHALDQTAVVNDQFLLLPLHVLLLEQVVCIQQQVDGQRYHSLGSLLLRQVDLD